eukprot:TRINITY_DN2812_c0_g1_i2.p1 TRINITY_DN2812_c0_g1~~TRINITY_DN2812_c0_g1_i2.p1  ORF type:complete len:550 (+),score=64.67 TRINITY_DN2812_c0_g1_i2:57-1706(+)
MSRHAYHVDNDLYAVLGVDEGSDFSAIRTAYKRAALAAHPDKGGTAERFRLVAHAFEVLSRKASLADCVNSTRTRLPGSNVSDREGTSNIKKQSRATSSGACAKSRAQAQCSGVQAPTQASEFDSARDRQHAVQLRLDIALSRLRSALQAVTAKDRKVMIVEFDSVVREVLLTFMSAESRRSSSTTLVAMQPTSPLSESCSSSAESDDEMDSVGEEDLLALENLEDIGATHEYLIEEVGRPSPQQCMEGSSDSWQRQPHRGSSDSWQGQPHRFRTPGVQRDASFTRYRAHIMWKCIEFYTRYQASFEVAVEHHTILAQLRYAVGKAFACHSDQIDIVSICNDVFSGNGTSAEEVGLRCFVRFAARYHLGSTAIISPVLPLTEAFSLQQRLTDARAAGWPTLREEWLTLLTTRGSKIKSRKPRSREEAETLVDRVKSTHEARRGERRPPPSLEERQRNAEERRGRDQERLKRSVLSRARQVHVLIASLARARRQVVAAQDKAARQEHVKKQQKIRAAEQQRKRRRDAVLTWSKRRDWTMADYVSGPPANL